MCIGINFTIKQKANKQKLETQPFLKNMTHYIRMNPSDAEACTNALLSLSLDFIY
jgi:hypothetical protein